VLERRVLDTRPPRVEYRLTDVGRKLGKTAAGLLSA
jgi:DNA-binding HxlR family transcriptional regulator